MNPTTPTRIFICGLLITGGAACAAQDSSGPSDSATAPQPTTVSSDTTIDSRSALNPSDSAVSSQPAPNPQTLSVAFSPSAVCDVVPLDEPVRAGDNTATMRIVAYGDVDSDDDVPCGMLSGVRIAIISEEGAYSAIKEKDKLLSWWTAVGGDELSIETYIPPGARVPTTPDRVSAAPAQFVTTGPDGIAEMLIDHEDDYSLCAISPANDLITGCYHDLTPRASVHMTAYIYFIHGHAIIEIEGNDWYQEINDRYQRFLDGEVSSGESAIVRFEATSNDDIEPSRPYGDVDVIVIGDDHVNDWWAAVSDNGANELDADRVSVGSEVLAYDWVHVVTTGPDGLAETALPPGDYLICSVTWHGRLGCIYENLASGYHTFEVNFWEGGNIFGIRGTDGRSIDSQPAPNPQTLSVAFSPSAVCDVVPLDEPVRAGDNTATMRIVAYGDVDSDDDVPCGMLSGVRVYAMRHEFQVDVVKAWWTAAVDEEMAYTYYSLPPGARVPTTAEKLSAVPEQPITVFNDMSKGFKSNRVTNGAEFITTVTTGPDGIAELLVAFDPESDNKYWDYLLCVISPVEDLISGCAPYSFELPRNGHRTAYVYFTNGHAIIETDKNIHDYNDRYQRFLDGMISSAEPALVKFEATSNDDIKPYQVQRADVDMIVVSDAHINAWWAANVSDEPYEYRLSSEALAHDWVHVVTTDLNGLAETVIPPGDYLICSVKGGGKLRCVHEYLTSGPHKFVAGFWDGGNALEFGKIPNRIWQNSQRRKQIEDTRIMPFSRTPGRGGQVTPWVRRKSRVRCWASSAEVGW